MQVAINFKNDAVAQKILWMLEHFKNDGIEIIKIDDDEQTILSNFKEGLQEIKLINQNKLNSKPINSFLNEI